jgi:hypothetical protein
LEVARVRTGVHARMWELKVSAIDVNAPIKDPSLRRLQNGLCRMIDMKF